MAFRNSVKVTMLSSDQDAPRSYPAQSALLFEPLAPDPEPEAIAPVSNDAAPSRVVAPAKETREISAAATWHARADELRAMTDTLPSAITRSLMPKIIALYDGFARAEGWSDTQLDRQEAAPATPLPAEPLGAEFPDGEFPGEEFPDDDAPPSLAPAAPAWLTFARRPLPSPRHAGRRRS
jgi:hypothetical protein